MRAVRFDHFGPPSVLRLVEQPLPSLAAGEALVAVRAAAVNPSDVKNVEGHMPQTRPPRTPGRDYAGVVQSGPPEWQGAEVWGSGGDLGFVRDGTHAEAVVVPVTSLRRKPARLSFAEAAAVGTPFATAHLGLGRATLAPGERVLVVGAAGAVGSAAVQIARWRGARVAAIVVSEQQAEVARTLGAEQVIVDRERDAARIARTELGADIDVAFDATGVSLAACVEVLRHGGRVVAIAAPPDGNVTFNLRELYRREGAIFGVDSLKLTTTDAAVILDELRPGFEAGALRPPLVGEWPLAEFAAAYRERGRKAVLVP